MPVRPGAISPAVRLVTGGRTKTLREENSRTVLSVLPSAEPLKWPQFIAALAATIGALCAGTYFSWTSSVQPFLDIDDETMSWVGSIMTLGAFVGCLPAGWVADRVGRQRTLLLLSIPFVLSWLCLALASSVVWLLLLGRLVGGVAVGALSVVTGMYVTEIAEPAVRGTLGSFFQLQITIGILVGYVAGLVHNPLQLGLINVAVPLLFAVLLWRVPESPAHLLLRGQTDRCGEALLWLRGPQYDATEEVAKIRHSIMETQQNKVSVKDLVGSRAVRRGMVVALGLMAAQQLSGVNAVIFYTSSIFKDAGSTLSGDACSIIVGVVQVISTYLSTVLVDRAGRRVLLLLSCGVMATCLAVLGVYFHLKDAGHVMDAITWLPLLTVAVFIIMFSLGMGPLPWCVVNEIFSARIRGLAASIACAFNWLLAFFVTKVFTSMKAAIGIGPAFWVFSSVCVLGTVFIATLVPETKGKSLDEIQAEMAGLRSPVAGPEVGVVDLDAEDDDYEEDTRRTFTL